MIKYSRFILDNGLRVLVHHDKSTPLVALNMLYDVGSRDEDPEMTGLAHLFEHLMFGGSINIPEFDLPLQLAGGENNAFTNNDITDYYLTLPTENIETGFWLESDRMLELLAKARNPERYKDHLQVDANVKAGVLVVNTTLDPDDWEAEYANMRIDKSRLDRKSPQPNEAPK